MSRVVVRLQDNQIRELLIELIALPQDGRIRDRWQSQEQLRVCIYRAIGSLGKDTFAETLPLLLATPVRGSKEFPTASDRLGRWQDPLLIVSSFFWKPTTPIRLRCREQVDELLAGIATAQGEERANLCIRAAYLMDAGLLSLEEVQKFAESLFTKAKTDEQGLPTETGCLDALVLSFPRWKQLDEVAAFRAKHCTASALADKSLWRDLRRTHVLARPGRRKPARNLSWQRRDLTAILDLAETWISSAKPPTKKKSQAELFSESMTNQSEELQVTFLDWLATLENVVLINKRANQQQRDRAEAIVVKAQQAGWCVAQVVAARAFLGYVPVVEAISEIRSCLGNRQPIIVRQACDAVGRWCQLGQSHGFSVPTELSEMLAALVTERRHESLSLLICACMDARNGEVIE